MTEGNTNQAFDEIHAVCRGLTEAQALSLALRSLQQMILLDPKRTESYREVNNFLDATLEEDRVKLLIQFGKFLADDLRDAEKAMDYFVHVLALDETNAEVYDLMDRVSEEMAERTREEERKMELTPLEMSFPPDALEYRTPSDTFKIGEVMGQELRSKKPRTSRMQFDEAGSPSDENESREEADPPPENPNYPGDTGDFNYAGLDVEGYPAMEPGANNQSPQEPEGRYEEAYAPEYDAYPGGPESGEYGQADYEKADATYQEPPPSQPPPSQPPPSQPPPSQPPPSQPPPHIQNEPQNHRPSSGSQTQRRTEKDYQPLPGAPGASSQYAQPPQNGRQFSQEQQPMENGQGGPFPMQPPDFQPRHQGPPEIEPPIDRRPEPAQQPQRGYEPMNGQPPAGDMYRPRRRSVPQNGYAPQGPGDSQGAPDRNAYPQQQTDRSRTHDRRESYNMPPQSTPPDRIQRPRADRSRQYSEPPYPQQGRNPYQQQSQGVPPDRQRRAPPPFPGQQAGAPANGERYPADAYRHQPQERGNYPHGGRERQRDSRQRPDNYGYSQDKRYPLQNYQGGARQRPQMPGQAPPRRPERPQTYPNSNEGAGYANQRQDPQQPYGRDYNAPDNRQFSPPPTQQNYQTQQPYQNQQTRPQPRPPKIPTTRVSLRQKHQPPQPASPQGHRQPPRQPQQPPPGPQQQPPGPQQQPPRPQQPPPGPQQPPHSQPLRPATDQYRNFGELIEKSDFKLRETKPQQEASESSLDLSSVIREVLDQPKKKQDEGPEGSDSFEI